MVGTFGVYFAPWSQARISTLLWPWWTDTFMLLPCFSPCLLHFTLFQICFTSFHFCSLPFKIVSRHFTSFHFISNLFHFISLYFKFVSLHFTCLYSFQICFTSRLHFTFTSFPFVSLIFTFFHLISRHKICFTSFHFILLHFKLVSFLCISFLSSLSPPLLGNFEALSLLASNSALHLLSVCHTISINGPGRGDLEVCRFKNNCRTSWPNFAPLRQRNRRQWQWRLKVPRRVLLYKWREHVLDIVSMTWSFDDEDLLKHPAL